MLKENMAVTNLPVASDLPRDPHRTTRKALVRVTRELIEELLHFPSGKILAVRDPDREGEFDLLVESPDFEPVKVGNRLPNRTIRYDTKDGRIIKSRWGG